MKKYPVSERIEQVNISKQDEWSNSLCACAPIPYYSPYGPLDGPVHGIRLQSSRSSLHVPLWQFLEVAAETIRQLGGIVLLPGEIEVLQQLTREKEKEKVQ